MDAIPAPVAAPPRPAPPGAERHLLLRSPARESARSLVRDPLRAPETLHPALWLGHQLGRTAAGGGNRLRGASTPSCPAAAGRAARSAELLLPHAGVGEIRLLAPALSRRSAPAGW